MSDCLTCFMGERVAKLLNMALYNMPKMVLIVANLLLCAAEIP